MSGPPYLVLRLINRSWLSCHCWSLKNCPASSLGRKLGKGWQHQRSVRAVWRKMRSRRLFQPYCGKLELYGRDCMAACCKNHPCGSDPGGTFSSLVPGSPHQRLQSCSIHPASVFHRGWTLWIPADAGETEAAFPHYTADDKGPSLRLGPLNRDSGWF